MLSKMTKNLFQAFNHGIKDINRHVRTISWHCSFKRISYNGLPLPSFFKDEWFTMAKLVIPMIMAMVNHVFVALWLHSWPWVWNIKTWDHEITMVNHDQPWKHGFHYSWVCKNNIFFIILWSCYSQCKTIQYILLKLL